MNIWLPLTLFALVAFGVTGVTQKICTNHISFELSFVYFSIAMVVVSAAVPLAATLSWGTLTASEVALIVFGGFLNGLGAYASFAAFETGGKASLVAPIINLYPLVTAVGAWIFLGEASTQRQLWGLALALVAVVLLSRETSAVTEI